MNGVEKSVAYGTDLRPGGNSTTSIYQVVTTNIDVNNGDKIKIKAHSNGELYYLEFYQELIIANVKIINDVSISINKPGSIIKTANFSEGTITNYEFIKNLSNSLEITIKYKDKIIKI